MTEQDELRGWKATALAMRDAAILAARELKVEDNRHLDAIENMYFDAAMGKKFFTGIYG